MIKIEHFNSKRCDDTVTNGTLSIQKSTYMSRYGHHDVHIYSCIIPPFTFIQLSKRPKHIEFDLNYVEIKLCK